MIRAGRRVVDRAGIAVLHGLSMATANRRKPWTQPGHPRAVNLRQAQLQDAATGGEQAKRGGPPQLWDEEQARAYAEGRPIPELPGVDHPDDLLDRFEAAQVAGVGEETWRLGIYNGGTPAPTASGNEVCGVPHWSRRTVERHRESRRPGRPVGTQTRAESSQIETQLAAILRAHETTGQPLPSIKTLAGQLGCHFTTVARHLAKLRHEDDTKTNTVVAGQDA